MSSPLELPNGTRLFEDEQRFKGGVLSRHHLSLIVCVVIDMGHMYIAASSHLIVCVVIDMGHMYIAASSHRP
jgi:hypothetical protein